MEPAAVNVTTAPPPSLILRRRNSLPENLAVITTASPYSPHCSVCAYTSLKDLLPSAAAINSPTPVSAANSGYEISIRNRLVKQAAWAYLQPMSSVARDSDHHFLRRIWLRLFSSERNPVVNCFGFIRSRIIPTLSRVFRRILRALWITKNR